LKPPEKQRTPPLFWRDFCQTAKIVTKQEKKDDSPADAFPQSGFFSGLP